MNSLGSQRGHSAGESRSDVRFDTWKEIAAYLQRDVRTVRRWEETRGLPVRRLAGGPRSQVFAYRGEIDAWLRRPSSPQPDSPAEVPPQEAGQSQRWIWVLAVLAVLGVASSAILLSPIPEPEFHAASHRPLTSDLGEEWYPAFSPDGSEIAYVWRTEEGSTGISVRDVSGSEARQVNSDPAEEHCVAWSPDGKTIAYCQETGKNRSAIVLHTLLNGDERELTTGFIPRDLDVGQAIAWSPDGRFLVVSIEREWSSAVGLHRVDGRSGEWARLTVAEGLSDSEPALSPDGRRLVFQRLFGRAQSDLFLQQLTREFSPAGAPERLTEAATYTASPSFYPDGSSILFSQGPFGDRRLWRLNLNDSGRPQPLSRLAEYLLMPTLSRDGTRLVYVRRTFDTNIWQLEVDENIRPVGKPRRLIASSRDDGNPAWSPNGKWIAFDSTRGGGNEIWVASDDGKAVRRVAGFEVKTSGSPSWSPDGRFLAFDARVVERADVYVAALTGGEVRRLTSHAADDLLPGWSHDGKWIRFASNRSGRWELWRIPASGGSEEQVSRDGALFHREGADGGIYATQPEGRDEDAVVKLANDGREQPILGPVYWYNCFDLLRGGTVYFAKPSKPNAPGTLLYRDETGRDRTLLAIDRAVGFGVAVSPDQRKILWVQQDGSTSDLMLVDGLR